MIPFDIASTDPKLLVKARRIAATFAEQERNQNTVGIVFLGAVVRGYFDRSADIDIAIFERNFAPRFEMTFHQVEGLEIQYFHLDLETEQQEKWDSSKRWAYSTAQMYDDPTGTVAALLAEKVPLQQEERHWSVISGMALSDWYISDLPDTWLERGDVLNAHYIIGEGIEQFLQALYALNNELLPAHKWRVYGAQRLPIRPSHFPEQLAQVMSMREPTEPELRQRQQAFKTMWSELLPLAEELVGKKYVEFVV